MRHVVVPAGGGNRGTGPARLLGARGLLRGRAAAYRRASCPTRGRGVDEPTEGLTTVVGTRRVYPPEPGDPVAIGPYTVLCRLPRGGQGADVFVARNTDDTAAPLVVIKCLPADAGDLNRRRFARAVQNGARIN